MIVKLLTGTPFGVSKLKRRLQRLVRVCTCQNATLLEILCTGSYHFTCSLYIYMYKKHCSFSFITLLIIPRLSEQERFGAIGMLQA